MKFLNIKCIWLLSIILSSSLIFGCSENKNEKLDEVKDITLKEVFHLNNDANAPSCTIDIEYAYLSPQVNNDSIMDIINKSINKNILGNNYTNLSAKSAVSLFKNTYISSYVNDVKQLYEEDLQNDTSNMNSDVAQWYNYSYKLNSTIEHGKEDIINYKATMSEYTGGAHSNQWCKWLNFNKNTGELVTLDKVFIDGAKASISDMLLKQLYKYVSDKNNVKVNSKEDLQQLGILDNMVMYVPDNFILGKDEISFLYNEYDIAPYSEGMIILSLPYSELEKYMYK